MQSSTHVGKKFNAKDKVDLRNSLMVQEFFELDHLIPPKGIWKD